MKNVLADGRLTQRGDGGGTHRPHMYPMPSWAWGMGVVGGCARAVPDQPPSTLTPLLHNLLLNTGTIFAPEIYLRQTGKCAVSNSSSLQTLFYSVIYNSVDYTHYQTMHCIACVEQKYIGNSRHLKFQPLPLAPPPRPHPHPVSGLPAFIWHTRRLTTHIYCLMPHDSCVRSPQLGIVTFKSNFR